MALLMVDSFAHYSVPQATSKWTSYGGTLISVPETGSGKALQNGNAAKTLPANYTTLANSIRTLVASGPRELLSFSLSVGDGTNAHLHVIGDGRLQLILECGAAPFGSGAPVVTSTYALSFGSIYHVQLYVQCIPAVTGPGFYSVAWTYNVLINGVSRLSGIANSPSGGGNIAHCIFGETSVFGNDGLGSWLGDFWCTDGELLGDCKIVALWPRANGSTIQWTPLSGSNYANVNTHVTADATYNSDSTPGDIDEYSMDLIGAFTGSIKGAQGVWRVENDSAFSSLCRGIYRNGAGTEVLAPSGDFAPSLNNYQFFLDPNRKSVFTGIDWTQAEIDGGQVGIKRVS